MLRLAVVGAAGRMGGAIIRAVRAESEISLSLALERSGSEFIGTDAGDLAGLGATGTLISDSINPDAFDVMVDFSNPASTLAHISSCAKHGKPIVVGTTGMSPSDIAQLDTAAEKIPILFAANMSVGVNVTLKLLEMAAAAIGEQVDIEVIEAHHKHKVDAPSGTALAMGEVMAKVLGKDLQKDGVFSRHGVTGERVDGSIGFSTIRGGDLAGEHTVLFIGDSERIEITHRATDRKIFANGAVRAARWLGDKPAGRYDMQDVLDLA